MAYYSPEEAFENLKQGLSQTIKGYFPIEGNKHTLTAKKVWVEDDKSVDDIRSQKDAKIKGRSWTVPIRAELELKDNLSGKVLDRQVVNVAQLPKVTRRYSYIVNGSEWQVNNVFRMKSGVYTRIRKNGELTSQWNLVKGMGFDMDFNPKTQKMHLRYGEAQIPLYPLLKTMGVDDDSIEKAWGKEILSANKVTNDEATLRKFYRSIRGTNPESLDEAKKLVLSEFDSTVLRPDSTELTLGKPYDKVTGPALLDGSHKILRVSRQEIEPDDRDALQFKDLFSAEDLINERLEKWKTEKDVKRKIGNTLDKNSKVRDIINPDIFGKPLRHFFVSSTLSDRPTQTNPLGFISGNRRTTLFAPGEGGISSEHQITLEAQSINPSHLGFLDPIQTPESSRIGVTLQLAAQVVKDGHEIKIPVFNTKTGKKDLITAHQALKSNLAFPDQYAWKGGKPTPIKAHIKVSDPEGTVTVVKPSEVDYVLGSSKGVFDLSANLLPFLQNDQGNRTMVATRQMEQAVALKNREIPLVQTQSDKPTRTFEQGIGEFVSHSTPVDGVVEKVKKDAIIIKAKGGGRHEVQIYDDFPLNEDKSVISSTPLVKAGDQVKAGQTIADTNFTRNGVLALGTNLRVAYMPWKGYNFEDGVVISETAAKKLTSVHLYRENVSAEKSIKLDKKRFLSYMAGKVTKEQAEKLDDDAVIREGQVVNKDDVIFGVLKEESISPDEQKLGLFSKGLIRPWKPREVRWTKDVPGVVVKVMKHGKDTTAYIRAENPADVGDKVVGRHGNKGIVSRIVSDNEMPADNEGRPVEVLLNPAGVPTRINLGQVLETAAAKIAEKAGKPYVTNNFDPGNLDYTRGLKEELKKSGVSDTEDLYDPVTKRKYPNVLVGPQYILKLHHTAEKGLSVRSRDAYDSNMLPSGGGPKGGQTMDAMGMYAMLAHNARENIREMQSYRSDMNDDFWAQLQAGDSIPTPKIPFVFKKFEGYLKGMGLDVRKEGNDLILQPLTDKKTLEMSNGALVDAGHALRAKDVKEEVGGIFDVKLTGGVKGKKWTHIALPERMPNPVFEGPISSLLGLNQHSFKRVVAGEEKLGGKVGPQAVVDAIKALDPKQLRKELEAKLPDLHNSKLDAVNKRLKYLYALERAGLSPVEAYTMKHLPVLPPVFRPFTIRDNGDINYDDVNALYSNVGKVNLKLEDFDSALPPEKKLPLQSALYDSVKAVMLTGGMHQGRHRNAIMQTISGSNEKGGQPKEGFFQDKIIGRRQDLSMRGVIIPEPSLSLDEVGLPRKAAAEIYKPFVVRRLVQMGQRPLDAQEMVKKNHPAALDALKAVLDERPIFLKRDPVLHKFGVQAFRPRLTEGKAIKIHPLVTSGYNADFDGDKMSIVGEVLIYTSLNLGYGPSEPKLGSQETNMHAGSLVAHRVIDIAKFPRIEESAEKDRHGSVQYDVPAGVFVPALANGEFQMRPVTKFHVHPDCEEWLVKTQNGREERVAADHSLVLLDSETLDTRKATPSEATGCCLPVLRSLTGGTLPELLGSVSGSKHDGRSRAMMPSVELTWDTGWFIGASVGDGWVSQPHAKKGYPARAVHLSSGDGGEEIAQKWSRLADCISNGAGQDVRPMPHTFEGYDCTSTKTTVCSTALGLWLEPLIGRKAAFKHLPENFLDIPLAARQGLFGGLVDTDGTANWNTAGQFALNYNTSSRRLAEEVLLLGLSLGLPSNITSTESPSGNPHFVVHFSIRPIQGAHWLQLVHPVKAAALKELQGGEQVEFGRNDFVPMTDLARSELLEHLRALGATRRNERDPEAFSLYVVLGRKDPTITRESVQKLAELLRGRDLGEYLTKWFRLAQDESVGWDLVTSSEPTGQRIEMYDLTVPDAWTFTMADGAVVWDSAFVPVSAKAVKEAYKMLPSANLFSPTTGLLMAKPTHESMLGIYKLTEVDKKTAFRFPTAAEAARAVKEGKISMNDLISVDDIRGDAYAEMLKRAAAPAHTTVGRLMLYQALPDEVKDPKLLSDTGYVLNKGNLYNLLTTVARKTPKDFGSVSDRFKDIGNEFATGLSMGLDDFLSDHVNRDQVLREASKKEREIRARVQNPHKRKEEIVKLYVSAAEKIHDEAKKSANSKKNRMYDWIKSGARGNWEQYKQMTVAPMLVADSRGKPVPIPIPKAYSEGLDIGSYFAAMHGARMGTIGRVKGTQAPGSMSKQLVNSAMDQLIVDEDCGSTKGVMLPIDNRDVLDRFTVKEIDLGNKAGHEKGKIPAGSLVTPDLLNRLKNNKINKIEVRSTLKCAHGKGLCSKCYGLNEDGNLHAPGVNVGIIAAQSLGEPAVQLAMNSFHTGGVVGAKGTSATSVFNRLEQLLSVPKKLPGAAALADVGGAVKAIEKDPAGGWRVYVGDVSHYVPADRVLTVKKGDEVKKGDALTDGPKNPRDMLSRTNMNEVQQYLTNEIHDIYKNEGPVRRRNVEAFVRVMTNLSEVTDPGSHDTLMHGDRVATSEVVAYNRSLKPGQKEVVYKPLLQRVEALPLELQTDWLARLQSTNLKKTILDASAEGWRSSLHGTHPIPGMAYGKNFGEGTEKEPWLY